MTWLYHKIEDLLHSLRRNKYQKDKFFKVRDDLPGLLPVEILKGSYKGTVFAVTDIKVLDEYGRSKFDFNIIQKIPGKHDSYYGDKFAKLVGEILLLCIGEAQSNFTTLRQEVLTDDADEPGYLEEPTPVRTIPTEGHRPPKR